MSKLLYSYEKDMPTVSMTRDYTKLVERKTGAQIRFRQLMTITQEDVDWCDVIYFIRPNDPYSVRLAQRARQAGCFVVAYYDDDLYMLPESLPNPAWRKNSVRRILERSDVLMSSSAHICKKYSDLTISKQGVVSDTAVEESEIKKIPLLQEHAESGKVKLVYAANPGHVSFFNQFILPIMPLLCENYGNKISMTFMGVRPDLSAYESQMEIHYIPGMPLAEYRRAIQEGNYDIGLSPMTTNDFTKCKYINKFIEYTMAGIVGMYSNTEPYTYVVKHNENGFLVNDDPQDWYRCLSSVIEDAALRNRCIRTAQHLLCTEFSADRLIAKQIEQIPQIVQCDGDKKPCKGLAWAKVMYRFIRLMDKAYLFGFYLRREGLGAVIKRVRG